jgi:hypothetical protein
MKIINFYKKTRKKVIPGKLFEVGGEKKLIADKPIADSFFYYEVAIAGVCSSYYFWARQHPRPPSTGVYLPRLSCMMNIDF